MTEIKTVETAATIPVSLKEDGHAPGNRASAVASPSAVMASMMEEQKNATMVIPQTSMAARTIAASRAVATASYSPLGMSNVTMEIQKMETDAPRSASAKDSVAVEGL